MTSRFRLALACTLALAVGVALTWILTRPATTQGPGHVDGGGGGASSRTPDAVRPDPLQPGRVGGFSAEQQRAGQLAAVLHGRAPSGIDYSDPAVRAERLLALLQAPVIAWREVRVLLSKMDEPLEDAAKEILLHHLHKGPNRAPVVEAFAQIIDPSVAEAVFTIYDDVAADAAVRDAALKVLARMPGGDDDTIATQLASRLQHDARADIYLLRALAQRSGTEATRAFIRYIEEASHPEAIVSGAFSNFTVASTPEAIELAKEAISRQTSPEVLKRMLAILVRPNMSELSEAVRGLDTEATSDGMRREVYRALARMGDPSSIEHLLERAVGQDDRATRALESLRFLKRETATRTTREQVRGLLERANEARDPVGTTRKAIEILGRLGDKEAKDLIWQHVDHPNDDVANAAIQSVGRLAEASRDKVEPLTERFDDGDQAQRMAIIQALVRIGGPKAREAVVKWYKEPGLDRQIRNYLNMANATLARKAAGH